MSINEHESDIVPHEVTKISRYATERSLLPMAATEGREHIVRYANPAFCLLSGKNKDELFGHTFAEVMPEGELDEGVSLLDHVYNTGEPEAALDQAHDAFDGTPVYWSYVAWTLLDKEHRPAGVMIQVTDTTDAVLIRQNYEQTNEEIREINNELLISRIREQELFQVRQAEGIGKLAGGIAHHFNNLLTAMLGFTELAQNMILPSDEVQDYLHNVKQAAERAAALTNQLLAYARKQIIQPNVLDLNALILDIEEMMHHLVGEHIELTFQLKPDVDPVILDTGQFGQVLINLVVNARDAMPDGGKLIVQTANVTLTKDDNRLMKENGPGEYVLLTVSDTGIGMSPETQKHLFEPFFTTKQVGQGTGMGLAACHGIVNQNGGFIHVDSALGRGTTFNIYLPRVDKAVVLAQEKKDSRNPEGKESILIVENEPLVRDIAAKMLRRQGYTVLEAANGSGALSLLQKHTEEIHLIVTDVLMPNMGGKQLAEKLRVTRPSIKTLFISGHSGASLIQEKLLDPEAAFLKKPFSMSSLAQKVRDILTDNADKQ